MTNNRPTAAIVVFMFNLSCQDAGVALGRGDSTGTSAGPEGALCDTRQDTRTLRARTFFLCSADTSGRHEASAYGTDNDAWDPHWFAWEDWRRSWGTIGASDPPVPHSAAAGFVTPEETFWYFADKTGRACYGLATSGGLPCIPSGKGMVCLLQGWNEE